MPSQRFFNRSCTLQGVVYFQDAAGGPLQAPLSINLSVPCAVQQDSKPERLTPGEGQKRRGSVAELTVFFAPGYSEYPGPAATSVAALKANDRITLDDGRTLVLDGPAYDASGRGACYAAACKYPN